MKTRCLASGCLLTAALIPAQALADPVAVTSGFFSVTGLGANAVFELNAPDFRVAGNLEPGVVGPDFTCFPCAAGEVISLSTAFEGSRGTGTAAVDGAVYPQIGFGASGFLFEAPDIVAPGTAGSFTVTRPFTFTGSLAGFQLFDPHETSVFQRLLVGQGRTTASFIENPNPDGPLFSFSSIRYDFAPSTPVPEPATLLLVATGLGAALRLHTRARRT